MINRKALWITGGLLLLAATIGFGAWKTLNPGEKAGRPVQTVNVKTADLESKVFVSGRIRSKSVQTLTADDSAKVLTVSADIGTSVSAGDILCTLDPGDLTFQITQKTIQLEQEKFRGADAAAQRSGTLKARLELAVNGERQAAADLDRWRTLLEAGAVSSQEVQEKEQRYLQAQSELVAARSAYESSVAVAESAFQVRLLESELQRLQEALEERTVRAPIDGVVTQASVKAQEPVALGQVLFVIEDPTQMEAVADISEFDIGKVRPGQAVQLSPSGLKGITLEGRVATVAPAARLEVSGQTRETVIEVRIDVLDPVPELRSNFSTDITILSEVRRNALVVPYEALYTSPDGHPQVFAIEDGKIRIRNLTIGIEGDLELEADFEGVREGLPLLLNPTDAFKEGDAVRPLQLDKDGEQP